jgi:cardiolipin synthase
MVHLRYVSFCDRIIEQGGDHFKLDSPQYFAQCKKSHAYPCALMYSFPGNPVNVLREWFVNEVKYVDAPLFVHNPYLIDSKFWDAVNGLTEEQSKNLVIINSFTNNDLPINGPAVRSNMYSPTKKGVVYYDYTDGARFSHWKICVQEGSNCTMHGSYNLNSRRYPRQLPY